MTADDFRRIALDQPEATQGAHMGHDDFRVGGKIFATLGSPDAGWGMVKLLPEQQDLFVQTNPSMFRPVKGGWGLRGATNVRLDAAAPDALEPAMRAAWLNTAPARLVRRGV